MEFISSRQNPLVKRFRNVAAGTETAGAILLDGPHLLADALAAGTRVDVVAFAEALATTTFADLAGRAQAANIRVVTVPPAVLGAMSPVRQPAGVVAIATLPPASLASALERAPQLVPVLVNVQDPGNVGTIVRTAEASGATGLVTIGGTASAFGWKALRASMGSALRLPIAMQVEPPALLTELRARGVRLIGTTSRGGTPAHSSSLVGPTAILLGSEGAGVPPELLTVCDATVTIPMEPPVESLNVATAGALLLFEAARQRSLTAES